MKSSLPVTMRQVAARAKVAVSTVSKALRSDPSISPAQSHRIKTLAERMGYRPNPMVATLMAQLHGRRRNSDPQNIAWLDFWQEPRSAMPAYDQERLLSGARERAHELGYGIEIYRAGDGRLRPERLFRVLAARGQWGFIVPPVPDALMRIGGDMAGLTGVTIGTSLLDPPLHRVSPNHYQGGLMAFQHMRMLGCSRMGLILSEEMNLRVDRQWLGAFLASMESIPSSCRVRPLLIPEQDGHKIARWMKNAKPDGILIAEEWVEKAAKACSPNVAMGWLMKPQARRECSGLDYRPHQIGRVAVEMIVAQIHRNERGVPDNPHAVLLPATWIGSRPARKTTPNANLQPETPTIPRGNFG